ncbi:ftsJ-like methyltransferase family protein [Neorickettsia helminthoeca str. Oregon]|uniref:Ribosomal RNA large subunit methyltransferase E n=1 Tax=Neorickettsia helminthoeca str. Oregon TaxID=1286528 RepID=X5GWQ5_9RICK|nr:RlmE family RNA methyltransferase [Neorickettsia helminthoeca]AHX11467.1 ftsJ-like methyltransferase family protein [Neorickettsia helminthoeca str. Oregon]
MKNRLRSPKSRKLSSNRWLYRHINDPFVRKARSDNYRSRASYKLLEINEKFTVIQKGSSVLELGSAPGGWTQVISQILDGTGRIVAADLTEMDPISGVEFLKLDIEAQASVLDEYLNSSKFDLVLSDLAPNASGSSATDSIASIRLSRVVLDYARKYLKGDGSVVMKILKGSEDEYELIRLLKKKFKKVEYFKPNSSRKASREIYLVMRGRVDQGK